MNKTYIVLLSSLIACTSMGMDNRKSSAKEQRDIEERERQKKDQDKLEAMRREQQRRIEQFKKDAEILKEGEAEKAQRESPPMSS